MKRFWNWVRNEDETRTLYLNGVIAEESWFEDEITPATFKEELFSGSGPIMLHINSPGGDCIAASQIYTMLMDYPHDVTVQIDGMAASAASVIAMAGTKVCMSPTSMMMIHNPFTMAMGDSDEMTGLPARRWRGRPHRRSLTRRRSGRTLPQRPFMGGMVRVCPSSACPRTPSRATTPPRAPAPG